MLIFQHEDRRLRRCLSASPRTCVDFDRTLTNPGEDELIIGGTLAFAFAQETGVFVPQTGLVLISLFSPFGGTEKGKAKVGESTFLRVFFNNPFYRIGLVFC